MLTPTAARVTAELATMKARGVIASFIMSQENGVAGVTVQMPDGIAGGLAWHAADPTISPAKVMAGLRSKLGLA